MLVKTISALHHVVLQAPLVKDVLLRRVAVTLSYTCAAGGLPAIRTKLQTCKAPTLSILLSCCVCGQLVINCVTDKQPPVAWQAGLRSCSSDRIPSPTLMQQLTTLMQQLLCT